MSLLSYSHYLQQHKIENWQSAVNFIVFLDPDPYVLFIKRSKELSHHGGEIAFLGGMREKRENSPLETALREFEEESSLSKNLLETKAFLAPVRTTRNNIIVPLLSFINIAKSDLSLTKFLGQIKSNGEWDELLIIPWRELSTLESWQFGNWSEFSTQQEPTEIHFLPITNRITQTNEILWGATAKIVYQTIDMINKLLKEY